MKDLHLQEIQSVSGGAASVAAISGALIGISTGSRIAFDLFGVGLKSTAYAIPLMCAGALIGQGIAKFLFDE